MSDWWFKFAQNGVRDCKVPLSFPLVLCFWALFSFLRSISGPVEGDISISLLYFGW